MIGYKFYKADSSIRYCCFYCGPYAPTPASVTSTVITSASCPSTTDSSTTATIFPTTITAIGTVAASVSATSTHIGSLEANIDEATPAAQSAFSSELEPVIKHWWLRMVLQPVWNASGRAEEGSC